MGDFSFLNGIAFLACLENGVAETETHFVGEFIRRVPSTVLEDCQQFLKVGLSLQW
jgi:hypothetical protein